MIQQLEYNPKERGPKTILKASVTMAANVVACLIRIETKQVEHQGSILSVIKIDLLILAGE